MVYPPRNLPGDAEKWGRAVEDRIENISRVQQSAGSSFDNLSRGASGQLASMGLLVEEITSRSAEVVRLPSMSVAGTETTDPYPYDSQTHVFPPLDSGTSGFLSITANTSVSPNLSTPTVIFVRSSGKRLLRLHPSPTGTTSEDPVESQGRGFVRGFCRIPVTPGASVPITVELYRGPLSTYTEITMSNISLSLSRTRLL